MRLQDQVCSLPLAKKLKEINVDRHLGFRWPLCVFYWWHSRVDGQWIVAVSGVVDKDKETHGDTDSRWAPAFTVAELGEILSMVIGGRNKAGVDDGKWWCQSSRANTEADARAKALILEIQNNIRVEEVKEE